MSPGPRCAPRSRRPRRTVSPTGSGWTVATGSTGLPDQSLDLVVCNPPFHRGPAKDSAAAYAMFAAAGRALRPGGELWVVYNSHLPYRTELRRVGHTEIVAQDPRFTVTRSVAR